MDENLIIPSKMTNSRSTIPIMLPITFIAMGLFTLIMGIIMLINKRKRKIECTEKVIGKITNIRRSLSHGHGDSISHITYYPEYEYNIGEKKYIKKSIIGTSWCPFHIGQEIEIYYNPQNNDEHYIKGDTNLMASILFIVVGSLFLIAGILLAIGVIF